MACYGAVNEEAALENLLAAKEKWGKKYPNAIKSWEDNWDNLITFFAFPKYIWKIMYTTNVIESLHSQFRKVTKTKLIFQMMIAFLKCYTWQQKILLKSGLGYIKIGIW